MFWSIATAIRIASSHRQDASAAVEHCYAHAPEPPEAQIELQLSARKALCSSSLNANRSPYLSRSIDSISDVEQFPRRIQMTFGGCQNVKLICLKSESLETMVNP